MDLLTYMEMRQHQVSRPQLQEGREKNAMAAADSVEIGLK
jgi:hypothetical protein